MGDYSRLLTKMAELRKVSDEYTTLTNAHMPAYSSEIRDSVTKAITGYTDKYSTANNVNVNAITNTKMPLVIRPGEDYGEFWKYIGKVTPATTAVSGSTTQLDSARKCWNLAAGDPRLFKKVVYTGIQNTNQPEWNNNCYGLVPDAPNSASYTTPSPGYVTMVGNGTTNDVSQNGIYTKLGIKSSVLATENANVANAMRLNDLQERINGLTREIVSESDAGINNELNTLVQSSADSQSIIGTINDYMNNAVSGIQQNYDISGKRKELSNIYADINEQTTLRSRKYRFVFYVIAAVMIICGYWSYTSKFTLVEQFNIFLSYVGWGWWTYWWIFAIVVLLFIVSTIGWDVRGNIMMVMRYVTDPEFWTGQLWWVGISFLMLVVIFLYATFKSFFSGIGDGIENAVLGESESGGDNGA